MDRIHLWRDKVLDLEDSARSGVISYSLGPVKAGIAFRLRIPVWVALKFRDWEKSKKERREQAESQRVAEYQRTL